MKIRTILLTGTILSLASAGALALAPAATAATTVAKLSGTYVALDTTICQQDFAITSGPSNPPYIANGYISTIVPGTNGVGELKEQLGTATFTPASKSQPLTGTVTSNMTKADGSLMILSFDSNPPDGAAMAVSGPKSKSVGYTVTASSITLNGTVYTAVYSNVVSGIAHRADFLGLDTNGCAVRGAFILQ